MTPTSWFSCLWGYLGALKTNLLLPEGGVLFNVPEILLLDVRDETEYASARLVTAPMQKPIKDEGGCNGNNRKPRRTRVLKKKKSIGSAWYTLLLKSFVLSASQLHWHMRLTGIWKAKPGGWKTKDSASILSNSATWWCKVLIQFLFYIKGRPDFPPNTGI